MWSSREGINEISLACNLLCSLKEKISMGAYSMDSIASLPWKLVCINVQNPFGLGGDAGFSKWKILDLWTDGYNRQEQSVDSNNMI